MNVGQRLKNERQRLAMTQSNFAAAGGIACNAQLHYEKGIRQPRADYLSALDSIGVDVCIWLRVSACRSLRVRSHRMRPI